MNTNEIISFFVTVSILLSIDFQLSDISPVVLQLFPTTAAHNAGWSTPHSEHIQNILYAQMNELHISY